MALYATSANWASGFGTPTRIAVPTPIDVTRRPDLRNVVAAVDGIIDVLRPGNHVIDLSVGTTEAIAKRISGSRT